VAPVAPAGIVAAHDVSKWMGEVVAVNAVSFGIGPGVTALLGPNGAGKSTLLRLLCGLTGPSRGQVRVLGIDPRHDLAVRARIGLAPQQEGVFEIHTAFEFVQMAGILHGIDAPGDAARAALRRVELDPDDTRRIGAYSKGMRQRVKLAQAIVHDPAVLFLDEPLTGLDPRQRAHLIELVQDIGAQGRCILLSSHVLEEVERFGSRVLVMAQGRLAAQGDFRAIRDLMDDRPHRIRIRTDQPRAIATALLRDGLAVGVHLDGTDTVIVETTTVHDFRRGVARAATGAGARLREVRPLDDDLESVFRYVVGAP
jgi:ABC-2 type transport system ATP-binding protein